jgi:hypothetical protein
MTAGTVHVTASMVHVTNLTPGSECQPLTRLGVDNTALFHQRLGGVDHVVALLVRHEAELHSTPGCQIGYMDRTGCHRLVSVTMLPTRVGTPGVRLMVTWTILAAINW